MRRTNRRCTTSGSARPKASRSRGKTSSRATSSRKASSSVLTKDDFKTAALEKTKTIDILDFVDPDAVDDRYFETPYYLLPAKGAERAYALLREAIRESGRIGIGKVILREAQHLAAVEVIEDAIVLTMMRFADELADLSAIFVPVGRAVCESRNSPWRGS